MDILILISSQIRRCQVPIWTCLLLITIDSIAKSLITIALEVAKTCDVGQEVHY